MLKMEIDKVSGKIFQQAFPKPWSAFNSVDFSELNKEKCHDIHYLLFRDSKLRLGIILGELNDSFRLPFSATYGGFSFNSNVAFQYYVEACKLLKDYVSQYNKPLVIKMASSIYNTTDNSKTFIGFVQAGAKVSAVDYDQYFELSRFSNYESILDSKIRNKLHNALSGSHVFEKMDSKNPEDIARAYEVIRINHQERGNPLWMSLQNVIDTMQIIPSDAFVASDGEGNDIAAAIIFHTTSDVYQIVYWGDIPSYSHLKSMNFLSYKVFEYYYHHGVKALDIGISTENGVPNFGLCEFKENIGCYATPKYTLVL